MNFFKKALIATAVAGTFGVVHAADLTDAVVAHSIQGLEVTGAADSSVRVIVREQLEAGDLITLVFGEGVDTTGLTVDVDGTPNAGDLNIIYGSGTYTLKQHADTDLTKNTLVLEVETGDPVTKDSSFEVSVPAAGYVVAKVAQATVTYSAESGLTGDPKDLTGDNVGLLITTQDQYAATVKTPFNGIIERVNQVTFESKGDLFANASNDADVDDGVLFDITDDQSLLNAVAAAGSELTVKLTANVKDYNADMVTATEAVLLQSDKTAVAAGAGAATMGKTSDTVATIVIGADNTAATSANEFEDFYAVLTAPSAAGKTLPVTSFDADLEFDFGGAAAFKVSDLDAGEWKLDATVINVPYFPVGYDGTSTSIHLANESASDVDVIVSAIDNNGMVYTGVNLGAKIAGETVTKVSQATIMSLFDITVPTKLSVTFNIDADDGEVNGYAFSSSAAGRAQLANSQQKGK
jgi:hypothetical protein